jgi:hypothetical protein
VRRRLVEAELACEVAETDLDAVGREDVEHADGALNRLAARFA